MVLLCLVLLSVVIGVGYAAGRVQQRGCLERERHRAYGDGYQRARAGLASRAASLGVIATADRPVAVAAPVSRHSAELRGMRTRRLSVSPRRPEKVSAGEQGRRAV